eukprot:2012805-Rhodomonas_salina.2
MSACERTRLRPTWQSHCSQTCEWPRTASPPSSARGKGALEKGLWKRGFALGKGSFDHLPGALVQEGQLVAQEALVAA